MPQFCGSLWVLARAAGRRGAAVGAGVGHAAVGRGAVGPAARIAGGDDAHAAHARRGRVRQDADVAARPAVVRVGADVGLAAVGGAVVAVGVARVAGAEGAGPAGAGGSGVGVRAARAAVRRATAVRRVVDADAHAVADLLLGGAARAVGARVAARAARPPPPPDPPPPVAGVVLPARATAAADVGGAAGRAADPCGEERRECEEQDRCRRLGRGAARLQGFLLRVAPPDGGAQRGSCMLSYIRGKFETLIVTRRGRPVVTRHAPSLRQPSMSSSKRPRPPAVKTKAKTPISST